MSSTLRGRRSLTQPPHLALNVSYSSLLASDTMLPQLAEDEGDIFSSTMLADPFRVPSFCLEPKLVPVQSGVSEGLLSLSTSTSTTSFDTTRTSLSFRSFSLLTLTDSCYTLADKPLPSLPHARGSITTKEITRLLALLDRLDDDVTREVVRVKAKIEDVRTEMGEYKAERSARREAATRKQRSSRTF
ncbi:hypothetical protein PILCRDRAFT_824075 [Piloderma croceum F 1598]|uniref:Uncharacterized protein n=1 Tax=Piloderma croceum (strain F 1598) TaxID=765440 RepID=A0A0C3FGJ6_PILCF|nr:hypothetical protein PILCRDRAFT_824075 [Piloderma croceum F 1598]